MKTCPKCNKEFSNEKKFCGECGVELSELSDNRIPGKPKVESVAKCKKSSHDKPSSDSYEIPLPADETDSVPPSCEMPSDILFDRSIPSPPRNARFNSLFLILLIIIVLIAGGYIVLFHSENMNPANSVVQDTTKNKILREEKSQDDEKASAEGIASTNGISASEDTAQKEKALIEEAAYNKYQSNYEELASNSDKWELSAKHIFDKEGNPRNLYIAHFLNQLESPDGVGTAVSKSEFLELLKDSRAKTVYSKMLIKYATPLNELIQKQEHTDLTKVFLQERRVLAGIKFLHDYSDLLSDAESKYNIPQKDIVSILMWESALGKNTGNYQIFNVFLGQLTLMDYAQEYSIRRLKNSGKDNPLDDPAVKDKQTRRLDFRRRDAAKSLASLLRICKSNGQDPLKQVGSWGGAIGFVQFMPYNLIYAVDGDKNGEIDLFDFDDAIYSVANYLVEVGNYGEKEESRYDAIFSYNRSHEYVKGVIAYADAIWARYSAGE